MNIIVLKFLCLFLLSVICFESFVDNLANRSCFALTLFQNCLPAAGGPAGVTWQNVAVVIRAPDHDETSFTLPFNSTKILYNFCSPSSGIYSIRCQVLDQLTLGDDLDVNEVRLSIVVALDTFCMKVYTLQIFWQIQPTPLSLLGTLGTAYYLQLDKARNEWTLISSERSLSSQPVCSRLRHNKEASITATPLKRSLVTSNYATLMMYETCGLRSWCGAVLSVKWTDGENQTMYYRPHSFPGNLSISIPLPSDREVTFSVSYERSNISARDPRCSAVNIKGSVSTILMSYMDPRVLNRLVYTIQVFWKLNLDEMVLLGGWDTIVSLKFFSSAVKWEITSSVGALHSQPICFSTISHNFVKQHNRGAELETALVSHPGPVMNHDIDAMPKSPRTEPLTISVDIILPESDYQRGIFTLLFGWKNEAHKDHVMISPRLYFTPLLSHACPMLLNIKDLSSGGGLISPPLLELVGEKGGDDRKIMVQALTPGCLLMVLPEEAITQWVIASALNVVTIQDGLGVLTAITFPLYHTPALSMPPPVVRDSSPTFAHQMVKDISSNWMTGFTYKLYRYGYTLAVLLSCLVIAIGLLWHYGVPIILRQKKESRKTAGSSRTKKEVEDNIYDLKEAQGMLRSFSSESGRPEKIELTTTFIVKDDNTSEKKTHVSLTFPGDLEYGIKTLEDGSIVLRSTSTEFGNEIFRSYSQGHSEKERKLDGDLSNVVWLSKSAGSGEDASWLEAPRDNRTSLDWLDLAPSRIV